MDWMQIVGERKIKEAMDAGVFDDNPLKGQPLNYDEDMGLPPEQRTEVARKSPIGEPRARQITTQERTQREHGSGQHDDPSVQHGLSSRLRTAFCSVWNPKRARFRARVTLEGKLLGL